MSLKEKINDDLKSALKSSDNAKRDTLRMLGAAIKNMEIEKKKKEEGLNDSEVQEVVAKAIKQRKDSVTQYESGGRKDLADKERGEIEILLTYLPEQLSEDEIRKIVKEVIKETGATSASDLGKVMGTAMGRLKGKADGQMVKKVAEEELK